MRLNIIDITNEATCQSLILVDELGSGTDPIEGGAVAMAVLDEFIARGSYVLITTHHGAIKNYGYTHPNCINASVEFSSEMLSPTYKILMGIPGSSHAIEIAGRSGIDKSVIEKAKSYINTNQADVATLIQGLTEKYAEAEKMYDELKEKEEKINEKYTKVHEIPFSSERKMMSVIFKNNTTQKYLVLVKGAIDRLSFSNADKEKVKEVHDEFASEALRVISLGSKELDTLPENLDEIENNLKFEGMVGIIDPPRVDAKSSVSIAKRAGIRTIMITGDHAITAAAIAKEIGILEDGTKIMSGKELAEISEEELSKIVKDYSFMSKISFCKKFKSIINEIYPSITDFKTKDTRGYTNLKLLSVEGE